MYNIDITKIEKGITHAGKFHSDDVFSTALLRHLNPNIEFMRVTKVLGIGGTEDDTTIVYDIGRGRFDHHQEDVELRSNGEKYAAFGLLWREFGHYVTSETGIKKFDDDFVRHMDYTDNTGNMNPMSLTINSFMPDFDEDQSPEAIEEAFWDAVDYAESVLVANFKRLKAGDRALQEVKQALDNSDGEIVILKRFAPFGSVLVPSSALYVIYPSLRGGYSAHAIATDDSNPDLKCPFPKEWRGADRDKLGRIIRGMTFCHTSGFMISADSVDALIKACRLSIAMNKDSAK